MISQKMIDALTERYEGSAGIVEEMLEEEYDPATHPHHARFNELIDARDRYLGRGEDDTAHALEATMLWYANTFLAVPDDPTSCFVEKETGTKIIMVPDFDKVARLLIKKYCIVVIDGDIYGFVENRFKRIDEDLPRDIVPILNLFGGGMKSNMERLVKDVLFRILNICEVKVYGVEKIQSRFIPVENGVLDRKYNDVIPNSPVFLNTYALPGRYDPSLDFSDIERWVKSVVDENAIIIPQIISQALLGAVQYQMAYLFLGGGQNGKSTLLALLRWFFGDKPGMEERDRISSTLSLQNFGEKYKDAEIAEKLINIYPDLSSKALTTTAIERLRGIISGDPLTVERKFGHPHTISPKAVYVFGANRLPDIPPSEDTFAFWRRWTLISFPHTFPIDPSFEERTFTKENWTRLFNWVLDTMTRIEKDGLVKTSTAEKASMEWKKHANPLYAFLEESVEECDPQEGENISIPLLREVFSKWAEENEVSITKREPIEQTLQNMGIATYVGRYEGKSARIARGIKWKGDLAPCDSRKEVTR